MSAKRKPTIEITTRNSVNAIRHLHRFHEATCQVGPRFVDVQHAGGRKLFSVDAVTEIEEIAPRRRKR